MCILNQEKGCAGFSLLELMAVMFIMFILMGIATVGLRGVVSGSGFSGAVSITRAAFAQARQHAMMQGRPTAVILQQDGNNPGTLLVIASYGRVADIQLGNELVMENELPWSWRSLAGARVYTFDGGSTTFRTPERGDPLGESQLRFRVAEGGTFDPEDPDKSEFAFQVGNDRKLPIGFLFYDLGPQGRRIFQFDVDGTVSSSGGLNFAIGELGRTERSRISVVPVTGKVSVGY